MSLDVYLYQNAAHKCSACGHEDVVATNEEVYSRNITHNLTGMADEAGIYNACWRPEEIGATKAKDIIPLLEKGLAELKAEPARFEKFNAKNGWGKYEHFVPFVEDYLEACKANPEATIRVSR